MLLSGAWGLSVPEPARASPVCGSLLSQALQSTSALDRGRVLWPQPDAPERGPQTCSPWHLGACLVPLGVSHGTGGCSSCPSSVGLPHLLAQALLPAQPVKVVQALRRPGGLPLYGLRKLQEVPLPLSAGEGMDVSLPSSLKYSKVLEAYLTHNRH